MRDGVTSGQPMSAEAPPREMPLSERPGLARSGLILRQQLPATPSAVASAPGGKSRFEPLTLTLMTVRLSPAPAAAPSLSPSSSSCCARGAQRQQRSWRPSQHRGSVLHYSRFTRGHVLVVVRVLYIVYNAKHEISCSALNLNEC